MKVVISQDGAARCLYDDAFLPAAKALGGEVSIERASHVEAVKGTTDWYVDLRPSGGPLLVADDVGEPFTTRAAALAFEKAWLEARDIPLPS